MTTTAPADPTTPTRYKIADYDGGHRVLVVQRDGDLHVLLLDVPMARMGEEFTVEDFDLEKLARDRRLDDIADAPAVALSELRGIANAYVEHAQDLGRCPLAEDWIG